MASLPHSSAQVQSASPEGIKNGGKQQQNHQGQYQAQEFKAPKPSHEGNAFHSTPPHALKAPPVAPARPISANVGPTAQRSEHYGR